MTSSVGDEAEVLRRRELAAFLRARRDAVQPEDVSIPRRGRRGVKGLRRHEVADLAAVSITWYTWLEQGRDIRTTPQVIDAVARALLLDEAADEHLRRLAGSPVTHAQLMAATADPDLEALVEELLPAPACLIDPTTELFAWNAGYATLFADPAALPPSRRSALMIMLTHPGVRSRLVNWDEECRAAVAGFRAEAGKHPGDQRFAEAIELLHEESELFRETWPVHNIRRFVGHEQVFDHPDVGPIRTRQMLLRPLGAPSLILMLHRLADLESRGRMEKLLDGVVA